MDSNLFLVSLFKSLLHDCVDFDLIESSSPVQCLVVPGNDSVKRLSGRVNDRGYDVRPILYPTVKKGKERIRICIHLFNSEEEVRGLVEAIKLSV